MGCLSTRVGAPPRTTLKEGSKTHEETDVDTETGVTGAHVSRRKFHACGAATVGPDSVSRGPGDDGCGRVPPRSTQESRWERPIEVVRRFGEA